jgi:hypothetical protein
MNTDIRTLLIQELPDLLENDPTIRESVWRLITPYYAPLQQTESRFDQMMQELRQMREESERKWAEEKAESERKWAEQNRKWWENQEELRRMREESERKWAEYKEELRQMREESERKWAEEKAESERKWAEYKEELRQTREESERKWVEQKAESERKWAEGQEQLRQMREESERKWTEQQALNQELLANIDKLDARIDTKIMAMGTRWGRDSEAAFRNALRGILEEVADVQVLNVNEFDDSGEVFGRPDQVELDIVIRNGLLMVCEIKASVSKGDVALFERKVQFYTSRHQRTVSQKIIISPMVDKYALALAKEFGMLVYDTAHDVFFEE